MVIDAIKRRMNDQLNKRILLISGGPSVGKSALVKVLATRGDVRTVSGFYTESCYEKDERVGFKVKTFHGTERVVARIDGESSVTVGRFAVDIDALEQILNEGLAHAELAQVVIIDELGKLECKSAKFRERLAQLFDANCPMLITSPLKGPALLDEVRARSDVLCLRINESSAASVAILAERWVDEKRLKRH